MNSMRGDCYGFKCNGRRVIFRLSMSLLGVLQLIPTNAEEASGDLTAEFQSVIPAEVDGLREFSSKLSESTVTGLLYERWRAPIGIGMPENRGAFLKDSRLVARGLAGSLRPAKGVSQPHIARFRGYLVPRVSGPVNLMISSRGNSELWVSATDSQYQRRMEAWIVGDDQLGNTKVGQEAKLSTQWTRPLNLKAGNKYYIELWHKGSTEGNHLEMRWSYGGRGGETKAIPADCFVTWTGDPTDVDGDGLPDLWQQENGLTDKIEAGSWDDPDKDGLNNFEEFVAGGEPLDPTPMGGCFLWERWYGIYGGRVSDLVKDDRFAGRPDQSSLISESKTPVGHGGQFGSRLSGFVTPKTTGVYRFAVTGDESTELWFSQTASPCDLNRVAFGTSRRVPGDWQLPPSQVTGSMLLEAGKSYYIEVIHKNDRGGGWAGIGWLPPGGKKFSFLPKEVISSPGTPAEDLNRDTLPDEWSRQIVSEQPRRKDGSEMPIILTRFGDPDHDGLPNWLEAKLGTDPAQISQVMETFNREWWFNLGGNSIDRARDNGTFLRKADMVTLSHGPASEAYTTDYFFSRYRAILTPPESGQYRFWVSGNDQVELWLSENGSKFLKRRIAGVKPTKHKGKDASASTGIDSFDERPGQKSDWIRLEGGKSYFIEVLQKDSVGNDHTSIAWQRVDSKDLKGFQRRLIDLPAILSYPGDADDRDDDYLPDSWERKYKLDSKDNGIRDHKRQGEYGDYDGDRLTNHEEYLLGTDPRKIDSDGDGLGDYEEARIYGSDPARKDAAPPVLIGEVPLTNFNNLNGRWITGPDGYLSSTSVRGSVRFEIEVEEPGIYLLEMEAMAKAAGDYVPSVLMSVRVDETEIGSADVGKQMLKSQWLTPKLSKGSHVIDIQNRNVRNGVSLSIASIALYRSDGEDLDRNEIPDWMEKMFHDRNHIDGNLAEAAVSPVCIEGVSRFPGAVALDRSGASVVAENGLEGRWFCNIPLNEEGVTDLTATFENGSVHDSRSMVWITTDVFNTSGPMLLRVGDALKLGSSESGPVEYFLDGKKVGVSAEDKSAIVRFDSEGAHTLKAVRGGSGGEAESAELMINVAAGDLGKGFDMAAGYARTWQPPRLSKLTVLEYDEPLMIEELSASAGERSFRLSYPAGAAGSPRILSRLWDGGPILSGATINAFRLVDPVESGYTNTIRVLDDGTKVIEVGYFIDGPIPPDLSIWLDMFVADAVFADGSTRYHLTAADFDENGFARILIYKAPGTDVPFVCHWIRPYDEDGE